MIDAILQYTFMKNAVAAALLSSVVAGIIGVIAVEKRLSSMAGGIAHAAFGGIGLGYLLGFEPIWGGLTFATASSVLIGKLPQNSKLNADTLTGILWSLGMALGILFISLAPGYMPDMSSYLFGDILSVSTSSLMYMTAFTCVVVLLFLLFLNHFTLYLLDEQYASSQGIHTGVLRLITYIIIPVGIIVMTNVVGIILTIALMTVPASLSKLLFKSIGKVVISSVIVSALLSLGGIAISYYVEIPSGACIVMLCAASYFLALFLKKILTKAIHKARGHRE